MCVSEWCGTDHRCRHRHVIVVVAIRHHPALICDMVASRKRKRKVRQLVCSQHLSCAVLQPSRRMVWWEALLPHVLHKPRVFHYCWECTIVAQSNTTNVFPGARRAGLEDPRNQATRQRERVQACRLLIARVLIPSVPEPESSEYATNPAMMLMLGSPELGSVSNATRKCADKAGARPDSHY